MDVFINQVESVMGTKPLNRDLALSCHKENKLGEIKQHL